MINNDDERYFVLVPLSQIATHLSGKNGKYLGPINLCFMMTISAV